MALIECRFYSEVLGLSTSMTVILPEQILPEQILSEQISSEQTSTQIGMQKLKRNHLNPTLYLLHGLSDDDSIWLRRTSIERYVSTLGLAVVMPQVHLSFYTDMAYGRRYWTFISEELPRIARSFFPLSSEREDNFVAGLSMGGYGAFKLALRNPDQFAAAASLSGALNMANPVFRGPEWQNTSLNYTHVFGEESIEGTPNDLFWLLKQCEQSKGPKPQLYQCCGTEDFLYEDNQLFRDAVEHTSFSYTYEEGPGSHEWGYWDAKIQDVLKWLPLRNL